MYKGRLILPALMAMALTISPAHAGRELNLEHVYQTVLDQNPQIQSYKAQIDAAEGNRLQQSLRLNPHAVFEVENFGGNKSRNGFDGAEYTLGIEQQFEVADKRSKRTNVADLERQQAQQQALASIHSILAKTQTAYMRVAIAQEHQKLAETRLLLADKTHETVKERISAAKSADIQHAKADIEVSKAEVAKRKVERELIIAKTTLSNLMGAGAMDVSLNVDIEALPELPKQEAVMEAIDRMPVSALSQLSVLHEKSVLSLARANSTMDPTFGLGVRRFSEDDGTAFMASISIPLAVFDRNQGHVAEAQANLRAAQANQTSLRLDLMRQAKELWQVLTGARDEVLDYQNKLIPSAQEAFAQAQKGFNRGAFSFIDLLDAQRTLFDVQQSHLEALDAFFLTKSQIDMISGAYESITNPHLEQETE